MKPRFRINEMALIHDKLCVVNNDVIWTQVEAIKSYLDEIIPELEDEIQFQSRIRMEDITALFEKHRLLEQRIDLIECRLRDGIARLEQKVESLEENYQAIDDLSDLGTRMVELEQKIEQLASPKMETAEIKPKSPDLSIKEDWEKWKVEDWEKYGVFNKYASREDKERIIKICEDYHKKEEPKPECEHEWIFCNECDCEIEYDKMKRLCNKCGKEQISKKIEWEDLE